jgi:hypothetical protein
MASLAQSDRAIFSAAVHLSFRPQVRLINSTREAVIAFFRPILGDDDATGRIAVAAHELLENAFKYSLDGQCSVEITMTERNEQNRLTVRVANRCTPAAAAEVHRLVDLLHEGRDPDLVFGELLEQSVLREAGSGLGLARIRTECRMDLECAATDERVTITASMLVNRGGVA